MPCGLKTAGQCFQRNIHSILKQLPFVFGYMDDIIIGIVDEDEHIVQMKQLFEVMNKTVSSLVMKSASLADLKLNF